MTSSLFFVDIIYIIGLAPESSKEDPFPGIKNRPRVTSENTLLRRDVINGQKSDLCCRK